MAHLDDLDGLRFGNWTVISEIEKRGNFGEVSWLCRCDCGNERSVLSQSLRMGASTSCGVGKCNPHYRHGMEHTAIYNTWAQMLGRCNNPNATSFKYYGAKGIKVCERWHDFRNFYADMGDKPEGKTLDRENNSRGYEPNNCRWATHKEQGRNKPNAIRLEWNGKLMSIGDIADLNGLTRRKLAERLRKGMSLSDAVKSIHYNRWNTPVIK